MTEPSPGAVLTVDLDAIVGNWRLIEARLAPGCRAGAVVKADGYGLGAAAIASALARAGCRRFHVATLAEGIALRAALDQPEILVMNGLIAGDAPLYRRHGLVPTVNSRDQLALWRAEAADLAPVLQIDSGMSRLGIDPAEAIAVAQSDLMPCLLMSHLACADDPAHPLNPLQLQNFREVRDYFPATHASLAASSGIFLGPEFHFDWVRPGAALYGVNPAPAQPNPMASVVTLRARILQLRDIDGRQAVGYGATYHTNGPTRLATVALGYADGLFRALSNRGHGRIGDRLVPLVGRVSMDLTIFDVSGVPAAALGPDAMIELIGPDLTIDQLADKAGTIGYEILTSLGPRLHRRYIGSPPQ